MLVQFDVRPPEERNRLTVALRIFLAIPHLIVAGVWSYVAGLAAIPQWFIIVFTGRRNEAIFRFQRQYFGYATRVNSYVALVHDDFPTIGAQWGDEPVHFRAEYTPEGNRLTTIFRYFLAIPALIVVFFVGLAALGAVIISWFAIVITGTMPRSLAGFLVRAMRLEVNVSSYTMLLIDDYPLSAWSDDQVGVLPPGDWSERPDTGAAGAAGAWAPPGSGGPSAGSWQQQPPAAPGTPGETVNAQPSGPASAGWYPDPHGQARLRYWDGSTWTEHQAD